MDHCGQHRRHPGTYLAVASATLVLATGTLSACGKATTATPSASKGGGLGGATTSGQLPQSAAPSGRSQPNGEAGSTCVAKITVAMSPEQKAGQLVVPALNASAGANGLDVTITKRHVSGVFLLGGWSGQSTVSQATTHLQTLAAKTSAGTVGLFIAADQEGGQIQQLRGSGFPTLPSALQQGKLPPAQAAAQVSKLGKAMKSAGVNIDLAPVADTVPAALGKANGPIGRWDRQFGSSVENVSAHAAAFAKAMAGAGVQPTIKHFPGIGRIRGNTDTASTGVSDATTTAADSYLLPFKAGIKAGANLVMVSNARYPKLDAANPAPFSRAVVTGLLRQRLGYKKVVVSDDLGAAKAISGVSAAQRAARFVAAGGDIALVGDPIAVPDMLATITARAKSDPTFAKQVDAALTRVLALKAQMGLLTCSS